LCLGTLRAIASRATAGWLMRIAAIRDPRVTTA
jgi:hypothetical protein